MLAELDPALGGLRLDELHSFVVLADELHFARAAKRLAVTSGGLSRRICHLERALGEALLVRTTRSVHLTTSGEHVLRAAAAVISQAGALSRCATSDATPPSGRQAATRGPAGRD